MEHFTYGEMKDYINTHFEQYLINAKCNIMIAERELLFSFPRKIIDNPVTRLYLELAVLLYEERNHLLTEEMKFEFYYCIRELELGLFDGQLDLQTYKQILSDSAYLKSHIPLVFKI